MAAPIRTAMLALRASVSDLGKALAAAQQTMDAVPLASVQADWDAALQSVADALVYSNQAGADLTDAQRAILASSLK